MTTTRLPADLLPADARTVPPERLPAIPEWWPVRGERRGEHGETLPPLTDEERAQQRHRRAVREACSGPYDGQRLAVTVEDGKPPRIFVPFNRQDVRYVLDERESNRYRLRYRYDTSSPVHAELMGAVSSAFAEVSPEYVTAAITDTKERPTP